MRRALLAWLLARTRPRPTDGERVQALLDRPVAPVRPPQTVPRLIHPAARADIDRAKAAFRSHPELRLRSTSSASEA